MSTAETDLFDDGLSLEEEIEEMFQKQSESEEIESLLNENIVAGVYENEYQIEPMYSTSSWSPAEIEEHLDSYFRFFSKSDMDLIYMHFIGDKTQVDLQNIFHKTQPAISCTVDRIQRQVEIVVRMQRMMDEFIRFISDPAIRINYRDRDILLVFFYTTSIIRTSQIIGISHTVCRTRIDEAVKTVKEAGYTRIYGHLKYILDNLNKVKKNLSDEVIIDKPGKYDYPSGHVSQELPFEIL